MASAILRPCLWCRPPLAAPRASCRSGDTPATSTTDPTRQKPAMSSSRILAPALRSLVRTADEAAALIRPGMTVAMSGFTETWLSEGRPGRACRPHRRGAYARRGLPDQRADGCVDRAGTRRRARPHQRHLDAPAVPVRPDVARQDQRRRSRLLGRPPEPCRAVRLVRAVRRSRCRDRRSRGHPRGRAADSVRVDRQQQGHSNARST